MKDEKIQVLRAIAIIAVVMIHTCPYGLEQVVCRPFLNFAVPLFLFGSSPNNVEFEFSYHNVATFN